MIQIVKTLTLRILVPGGGDSGREHLIYRILYYTKYNLAVKVDNGLLSPQKDIKAIVRWIFILASYPLENSVRNLGQSNELGNICILPPLFISLLTEHQLFLFTRIIPMPPVPQKLCFMSCSTSRVTSTIPLFGLRIQ